MFDHLHLADRVGVSPPLGWDASEATVPVALWPSAQDRKIPSDRRLIPVGRRPPDQQPTPEEPTPPDLPDDDPDDSDLEDFPDLDDSHWEAFVPDDDECDPEPEPGDFWTEVNDEARKGNLGHSSFVISW